MPPLQHLQILVPAETKARIKARSELIGLSMAEITRGLIEVGLQVTDQRLSDAIFGSEKT